MKKRQFWIIEKRHSNSYTSYKGDNGFSKKVEIGNTRIGPFDNIYSCCSYLSENASDYIEYQIEEEVSP